VSLRRKKGRGEEGKGQRTTQYDQCERRRILASKQLAVHGERRVDKGPKVSERFGGGEWRREGGTNVSEDDLIVNERSCRRDSIELEILRELELGSREDGFHDESVHSRVIPPVFVSSSSEDHPPGKPEVNRLSPRVDSSIQGGERSPETED